MGNSPSVTPRDAYDHQDALGENLIGVAANHGIGPSQAREEQYEVVA